MIRIKTFNKIALILIGILGLTACNKSPRIDFHSYQELCGYSFFNNGWFPDILRVDAIKIQETYDVNNKHLFGKFDFTIREAYDSIVAGYPVVERDSVVAQIEKIKTPCCPEWFVPNDELSNEKYLFVYHNGFYLIMDKRANRFYFLR